MKWALRPAPRALRGLLPEAYAEHDGLRAVGRADAIELGPELRVLCWNILKAKRAAFTADFRRLAEDRDLVLLQESVLNAPSDALFTDDAHHRWIMARSFRDPRSAVEHGVKTGARASPLDASCHVSRHAEPVTGTPKMLLATRYALASSGAGPAGGAASAPSLLVLNMHAINFVSVGKYLDQLGQLAGVLDAHEGPVLLAGDFNTWSARRHASFLSVAGEASLVEAEMERGVRLSHLNSHLDHVFYRGLELRSIASLGEILSSDHAPILATFECPGGPSRPESPDPSRVAPG